MLILTDTNDDKTPQNKIQVVIYWNYPLSLVTGATDLKQLDTAFQPVDISLDKP